MLDWRGVQVRYHEDWSTDRESVTQLYVKPAPARVTPARFTPAPPVSVTMTAPRRPQRATSLVGIGFLAACVLIGIAIGTALSLTGGGGKALAAPAAPVVAAPAPASPAAKMVVTPIEPPAAAPQREMSDTEIIQLVEDNTPPAPPPPPPPPAPVAKPAAHHHHHDAPTPAPITTTPVAKGTLLVSAKPPCAIAVDGRATGLTTPQRALPLAAGHHEITLTNAEQGIQITTDVDITADQATRLVQDFTK